MPHDTSSFFIAGRLASSITRPGQGFIELAADIMSPRATAWPMAKFQREAEAPPDFYKRFTWKINATRRIAIWLAIGSVSLFLYGVYRVVHAALS
jgi:hypothetical protein